jgi:hypothetical protein
MIKRLRMQKLIHPVAGRLLLYPPPTLRRGFNGFCTSNEKLEVSGAKARRPLRQAQGGLIHSIGNARTVDISFKNGQIHDAQARR